MKKTEMINVLSVGMLACLASAWSFFSFASIKQTAAQESIMSENFVFDEDIILTESAKLVLNGRDFIEIFPNSEVNMNYDEKAGIINVYLKKGSGMFGTLAGDTAVVVHTDFARAYSENSMAYFSLAENTFEVYALKHPTLLSFVKGGVELNSISLPQNYRTKALSSKVVDALSKLRLTKLYKEFPIYEFSEDELNKSIVTAFNEAEKRYTESAVNYINAVQSNLNLGPSRYGLGSTIYNLYSDFRSVATFLPHAKEDLLASESEAFLDYSISNAVRANEEGAQYWLDKWLLSSVDKDDIADLKKSLFFVLPGDSLYAIKSLLGETLLRTKYREIESLIERSEKVEASSAFKDYIKLFESNLEGGFFEDSNELSREYILIEILLRNNSVFYNSDAGALLNEIEDAILSLADNNQDLDEERLSFIQSKIRFLENLFDFAIENKISVEVASDLAEILLADAQDYLNSISTKVAVSEYFEQKLSDFEIAIKFLNSEEFSSYSTFEEGLQSYKEKLNELQDLNEYIQQIRQGTEGVETAISLEDAKSSVETDLSSNAIQYSGLSSLGDAENRLFMIEGGRSAGYSFDAKYDRVTQIIYDISVEELGLNFGTGIKVEDFTDVIKASVAASSVDEDEDSVEIDQSGGTTEDSSLTEDVAIAYAESQFEAAGFNPGDFDISLVSVEENTFDFEGVATYAEISVSGTYDLDSNKVADIIWYFDGQSRTLPDMDLNLLEDALSATYEAISK